jgi:hypothetical protein
MQEDQPGFQYTCFSWGQKCHLVLVGNDGVAVSGRGLWGLKFGIRFGGCHLRKTVAME